VIAGTVIGDVRQVFRFPGRDQFASWNGTAPVEVSSGDRKKACRLSLRGNLWGSKNAIQLDDLRLSIAAWGSKAAM
jgi:Transposase IS116/IS110/IS902 family